MNGKTIEQMNVSGGQPVGVQLNDPVGLYFLEVFDGHIITCKNVAIN